MERMYGIEEKDTYHGTKLRYYSLYNGARGAWYFTRKEAVEEGERHQRIIEALAKEKGE